MTGPGALAPLDAPEADVRLRPWGSLAAIDLHGCDVRRLADR